MNHHVYLYLMHQCNAAKNGDPMHDYCVVDAYLSIALREII